MDKLAKIVLARRLRHKLDRKRTEAIKMLSSKRATELGLNADTTMPIPNLDKMKRRQGTVKLNRIRASIVAKHRLNKVVEKIVEVK